MKILKKLKNVRLVGSVVRVGVSKYNYIMYYCIVCGSVSVSENQNLTFFVVSIDFAMPVI